MAIIPELRESVGRWIPGCIGMTIDEIVTSTEPAGTILMAVPEQMNTIRDVGKCDLAASDFAIANRCHNKSVRNQKPAWRKWETNE